MAPDLKPVLHFVIDFSEKKRHLGIPLNPYPFHEGGRYHWFLYDDGLCHERVNVPVSVER